MDKSIEHTIIILKNKILMLEARMLKLKMDGMEWDGTFRYVQKLKECVEILQTIEEIK